MMTEILQPTTRERILRAGADLLAESGRDAVSTRAVSAAAGVQPPTLYRLFGDKDGLLDAVAAFGFEEYLRDKHEVGASEDPVVDLRRGWDVHVNFGLAKPAFYVLMYGDTRAGSGSKASREADNVLHRMVSRVAAAGRLRMTVERAAALVHATGVGVVLTLIATPPEERDPELSAIARENVLSAITGDSAPEPAVADDVAGKAVALREALRGKEIAALSAAERVLLAEWLDRVADSRK